MAEKVLLVDDEKDFLDAMAVRMEARDMVVVTASSAQDAIGIIEKDSFDAIILDYQLPGMDGLNILKQIKNRRPESRIILLTGFATIEKKEEAMKMGALDLLEKPVDLHVLSQRIKQTDE